MQLVMGTKRSRKRYSLTRDNQHRDFHLSRSLQQLKELKRVFPNTGLSQLWHIPDETPHVAFEEEVYSTVDPREVSMQSLVYHTLAKQVQWGIDHEKTALNDYLLIQSAISKISVEEAGLTLYPTHSFLGASSDGWISDPSLPHAVRKVCLEIKCPYSIKGTVITDREVEELLQYKDFCLERTEQGPQLKRSHPY
ncbi:hypothetical protein FSP39_003115 [Pinctada imbricata]|uniref:YqaJ viral recombinase domain-containing protein n=1 Tax=Pinctada imbricata TaxID=66713 RepID=A0AA88YAJ6_PINIB|nr:hypothetical protein FSP39_003115 [Pinctada imbricata]